MGAHHPRHAAPETKQMRRLALVMIAPVAVAAIAAMIWLWPAAVDRSQGQPGAVQFTGDVITVERIPCPETLADDVNGCGTAAVRVTEGAQQGQDLEVPLPNGPGAPEIAEGDHVVLIQSSGPDGEVVAVIDHQRGVELGLLAVAFALAVTAFGRWRGVAALAGLAVTFAVLVFFVVPAILVGEPPVLVAIVGSAVIMLTVLYLTHGISLATSVAVLGTLASLTLTGLLSFVAVSALHLTGITDDLSTALGLEHGVDMEGLLLAGIVIGSLGVLDDVTVTQSATVTELARANPTYRFAQLYRAASRVGRSHIASVINTIILAYAGASLPLLILIIANSSSFGGVVTDQVIAQEIVRSAVATLGLVAAVPITTALAAVTSTRATGH
jgi:uncharacterized membrane protein